MAQRTDERNPTKEELETYTKILKLSDHVRSVAKPKEPKPNNKHIAKRNLGLGNMMVECVVQMGADVLEANTGFYVGANISKEERIRNYKERIKLEEHAKRLTFSLEHIYRMLYYDDKLAESTNKYMLDLITETREMLTNWRESELKAVKQLKG